jgi:hypothetical protein
MEIAFGLTLYTPVHRCPEVNRATRFVRNSPHVDPALDVVAKYLSSIFHRRPYHLKLNDAII